MRSRTIQLVLVALGLVGLGVALWDASMGGFYFRVLGMRVSSWEAYKPFRIGMLAMIAAIWLHDSTAAPNHTCWSLFHRWAPWIAAGMAVVSVAMAVRFGIFTAAGADGYGYVSQASLWAQGRLVVPDPLADVERVLGRAVAPVGFRLAPTPGAIVPVYPAGLPMAMAIPLKIAGPPAVYYVVPILGGIAVWLTYVLGTRVDSPLTGLIAAILIGFSPLFMFHTLVPMSDVPVTTWWLLAWVLAISPLPWTQLGAGFAVSAAVLTRPNLVPLAIVLAAVVAANRPRLPRLALFAAGAIPGCLIVAAINVHLYGSSLASGYGPLEAFYAWDRWPANLRRYAGWTIELNSPGLLLAFLAPLVTRVRLALAMLAFFVLLLLSYLFYLVFDTWPFLRFLLPAFPLLFVLASAVVVRGLERLPGALRSTAVFLLCILLPIWYVAKARSLTVFDAQRAEHRYPAIGEEIGRTLPAQAIVLTQIESGSVRLYGKRMTARWDFIEAARFDDTVDVLRRSGYDPYLLLEDWEIPLFQNYVGGVSQYGALDWPPTLEYRDLARVDLYRLADRAQHRAGAAIVTRRIGYRR
jgi:oligosaccharyl transferase STT3 subunit